MLSAEEMKNLRAIIADEVSADNLIDELLQRDGSEVVEQTIDEFGKLLESHTYTDYQWLALMLVQIRKCSAAALEALANLWEGLRDDPVRSKRFLELVNGIVPEDAALVSGKLANN